jgi:hypothetical protein
MWDEEDEKGNWSALIVSCCLHVWLSGCHITRFSVSCYLPFASCFKQHIAPVYQTGASSHSSAVVETLNLAGNLMQPCVSGVAAPCDGYYSKGSGLGLLLSCCWSPSGYNNTVV